MSHVPPPVMQEALISAPSLEMLLDQPVERAHGRGRGQQGLADLHAVPLGQEQAQLDDRQRVHAGVLHPRLGVQTVQVQLQLVDEHTLEAFVHRLHTFLRGLIRVIRKIWAPGDLGYGCHRFAAVVASGEWPPEVPRRLGHSLGNANLIASYGHVGEVVCWDTYTDDFGGDRA